MRPAEKGDERQRTLRLTESYKQTAASTKGGRVPTGSGNRVNRGGNFNNNATNCRSANRNNNNPSNRNNNIGFRPANPSSARRVRPTERTPVACDGQIRLPCHSEMAVAQ